jgi:acyl-coenzyme A thioesterase PaaI-like protein
MSTIDATLRSTVAGAGDDLTLTLDPAFQGLPDTAHGGSVLALFDVLAARRGARTLHGRYHRRVPLGVPLSLRLAREPGGLACRVADGAGAVLVDGGVADADTTLAAAPPVAAPGADAAPLPVSSTCFACGVDNALGLAVRLGFDARAVGGVWTPRPAFAAGDGRLSPAALTTLLDETAFWLGALATGESGMTTELAVTLHGDAVAGGAVVVGGERAATRARTDDARYWDTRVAARDEAGRLLATATITFVAVRGAARRLVTGLFATNPPEIVRRVFPAYCA